MLEFKEDHNMNLEDCNGCWSDYPKRCSCGWLIHAEFGDENWDGDYWLYYECNKCGDDYDEV